VSLVVMMWLSGEVETRVRGLSRGEAKVPCVEGALRGGVLNWDRTGVYPAFWESARLIISSAELTNDRTGPE